MCASCSSSRFDFAAIGRVPVVSASGELLMPGKPTNARKRAWLFRKWLKMVIIHLSAFATVSVLHSESMPSKPTQTPKEE